MSHSSHCISRRDFLRALAASALLPIASRVPMVRAADGSPNILIVVADALAARHMSLYGYDMDNTLNLARLAERGTVFHNHYSGGNYTSPGTASLLTGTLPWTHRTFNLWGTPVDSVVDLGIFQQFAKAGYHTLGFAQNMNASTVIHKLEHAVDTLINYDKWHLHYGAVSRAFSHLPDNDYQIEIIADNALSGGQNGSLFTSFLADVFEIWQANRSQKRENGLYPLGYPQFARPAGEFRFNEVVDGITNVIKQLPDPFMGYVHLFPPHAPYRPTKPYYEAFKDQLFDLPNRAPTPFDGSSTADFIIREQNYYDAFIAEVDAEFGRMMDMLNAAGMLDNTWVVFTSDHGELFSNGYADHSTQLMSDDLVHVPLILFPPKMMGVTERRDVYDVTSCVDLIPTLLNIVGETADERHEGRLLPGFGGDETTDHPAFTVEAKRLNQNAPLTYKTSLMMRHGQYKLERYIGYDEVDDFHRLFDLANDPLELNDISGSQRGVAADLIALLHDHVAPYQQERTHY